MRNGYIVDFLTSVDIQKTMKIGGKLIRFYEEVIFGENFKTSPSRKAIEKLFASRRKNKDKENLLMQSLVKLKLNTLYGIQTRKDPNEFYICKSEYWMQKEYDNNVLGYGNLPNGNYIVKFKKDDGLDAENDKTNTLPSHLENFVLGNI